MEPAVDGVVCLFLAFEHRQAACYTEKRFPRTGATGLGRSGFGS